MFKIPRRACFSSKPSLNLFLSQDEDSTRGVRIEVSFTGHLASRRVGRWVGAMLGCLTGCWESSGFVDWFSIGNDAVVYQDEILSINFIGRNTCETPSAISDVYMA